MMKALIMEGPRRAVVREVPTPEAAGDMVRIKVMRTGICATDQAIYSGDCSFIRSGEIRYPVRIGHEYSGIVDAVGPEVKGFRPGDRVFSDCAVTCGRCPACLRKNYGECADVRSLGTVHTWDGCFAEYMLMPERHVFHLPDPVSLDEAALIEPVAVAYDAFRGLSLQKSDTVAVIGAGPIGMASVWLAKNFGAGTVVMAGRNERKLAIARQVGADVTINTTSENPAEALRRLTQGRGADMFIEASGAESALVEAIQATRRDGLISIVSFYDRDLNNLPIDNLVLRCLTLRGTAGRFGNPPAVCAMMEKSPIRLTPVITHRIRLEDCPEYFADAGNYQREKVKVMVEFDN